MGTRARASGARARCDRPRSTGLRRIRAASERRAAHPAGAGRLGGRVSRRARPRTSPRRRQLARRLGRARAGQVRTGTVGGRPVHRGLLEAAAGTAARGRHAPFGPRPHAGHAHPAAQRARAALGTEGLDRKARPGAAGGGRAARARLRHLAGLRARQRGDALGRVLRVRADPRSGHARLGRTRSSGRAPANDRAGVALVTLHGCGHIPTWDNPSQVARVLLLASA